MRSPRTSASPITISTISPSRSYYPHPMHGPALVDLPSEIIPRLYIGNLYSAESEAVLTALGITHILSAMVGAVRIPDALKLKTRHCKIPLTDAPFTELAGYLPTTTAFLQEALQDENARVLVHCFRGVSRSASVVCAFLMAEYGWSASQAVQYVKSKRLMAEPNFGFVGQLREYGCTLGHPSK